MAYISFQPNDYFNTKLYTGNGSTQSITGVGFQPDFCWLKQRNNASAYTHQLYDVVRGVTNYLVTSTTAAEVADANGLTAFGVDGFSIGSGVGINDNSVNHVSWNWKANGSGSSNTDGSITSTVSANTTSGFSIVKWSANISSAVTVGHGLGVTPKVIILKAIDTTSGWIAGGFGLDWSGYLVLNGVNAFNNDSNDTSGTGRMFSAGGTEPSSTIFSTNSSALVGSSTDIIAYCFAEKKGFSKFGSYEGNGNTDGSFVYTGFKPAFVMMKGIDSGGSDNWNLCDNKRVGYNAANWRLYPNAAAGENSTSLVDLLSNGFKLRVSSTDVNASAKTYIYMAFAEAPIVSSNGVPAVAR